VLWLARRHWLLVRPALAAGFVVGGLMAAVTLSASPAAWFAFDTAQPTSIFWLRQAGRALAAAPGKAGCGGAGPALSGDATSSRPCALRRDHRLRKLLSRSFMGARQSSAAHLGCGRCRPGGSASGVDDSRPAPFAGSGIRCGQRGASRLD